jgi:hypothetical protein
MLDAQASLAAMALRGNRNTGHEFNNGRHENGIIGPKLSPDERRALVEFLKAL